MAKNTKTNQNDLDSKTNDLSRATQGSQTAQVNQPCNTPGGTNSLSPAGSSHPTRKVAEPPSGDKSAVEREDPQRIEGERTAPSESVIKQRARDEVDLEGSSSAIDEENLRQIPEDAPTADSRTSDD